MNDQHTQEPWVAIDGTIIGEIPEDGQPGNLVAQCGWYPQGVADARRIVACVNACKGIATEVLEEKETVGLAYLALYQERDEAVKMAEKAEALLRQFADYRVQPYAGARYECIFCGALEGHRDGCISLEAEALAGKGE